MHKYQISALTFCWYSIGNCCHYSSMALIFNKDYHYHFLFLNSTVRDKVSFTWKQAFSLHAVIVFVWWLSNRYISCSPIDSWYKTGARACVICNIIHHKSNLWNLWLSVMIVIGTLFHTCCASCAARTFGKCCGDCFAVVRKTGKFFFLKCIRKCHLQYVIHGCSQLHCLEMLVLYIRGPNLDIT